MSPRAKKRTVMAACGLLVTGLASRVFYFQELFFSLLLFAGVFFVLFLLAVIVAGVWMLYERAVIYVAAWTLRQGHRAFPPVRAGLLALAPRITKTFGTVRSLRDWVQSLRRDASHFRADTERAAKRLLLNTAEAFWARWSSSVKWRREPTSNRGEAGADWTGRNARPMTFQQ